MPAVSFLKTSLNDLEWLAPQRVRQLAGLGLSSIGDILSHYPRRYEDRRKFDRFPAQESDTPVCLCGTVVKASTKRLGGWKSLFEIVLEEESSHALSQPLVCRWFNVHFVQKMVATGHRVVIYGKPKLRGTRLCIDHPDFEVIENEQDALVHLNRIAPIYRATEGLSQRVIRGITFRLVETLAGASIENRLPPSLDSHPYADALREIHFPVSLDSLQKARRHLILNEFFAMQLFLGARRAETTSQPGQSHSGTSELMERFQTSLPLTSPVRSAASSARYEPISQTSIR